MLAENSIVTNELSLSTDATDASKVNLPKHKIVSFDSVIHQGKGIMDMSELFADIDKFLIEQRKRLGMADDERFGRGHPLQHILNVTSGGYVSPTGMKGFEGCPAGNIAGNLFQEKKGSAVSLGHTFHAIMQRFYDGENRTRQELDKIMLDQIKQDKNEADAAYVKMHVDGYWDADDYEPERAANNLPIPHAALKCSNELFLKPVCKPLGVDLGVPVYLVVDRVDIRKGINVIDYKTGDGDPNPYLLGEHGYLPQMIFYKWGVEAEYGEKVENVWLSCPGAHTRSLRWVNMNVSSLVEQSKVVDQVFKHIEHARKCKETRIYEISRMRYCSSCAIKNKCAIYLESRNMDLALAGDISVHVDVEDWDYQEKAK